MEASASKLKVLEAELSADWASLLELHQGSQQLNELLRWLDLEHRRTQAATAEALVDRYLSKLFPVCSVGGWKDLPGQLALLAKLWEAERQGQVGARRAVVLLDFSTPHSRDSLRLPSLVHAVATTAKVYGPTETIVVVWMPNLPKEGSAQTAEEDEAEISTYFRKEGFAHQTRIRMFLSVHPSVANKTSEMDWWADGRLLSLVEPKDNYWMKHSELARIRRVLQEPCLPQTKDLVRMTSLSADEDINVGEHAPDLEAKYAQRGPTVAEVQLTALLSKVPMQPKDETVILDLLPYVGDRVLGTYQFLRGSAGENRGLLRHIMVKLAAPGSNVGVGRAAAFAEQRLRTRVTKDRPTGKRLGFLLPRLGISTPHLPLNLEISTLTQNNRIQIPPTSGAASGRTGWAAPWCSTTCSRPPPGSRLRCPPTRWRRCPRQRRSSCAPRLARWPPSAG